MNDSLIPGTTIERPKVWRDNLDGHEYMSPADALLLNVGYLVDPDFRHSVPGHKPIIGTPDETVYADMLKKRLGISFGTDYHFPNGLNARTFQAAFLAGVDIHHQTFTTAEHRNLDQTLSVLQELNPEEFKKLTVGELTEAEKSDVIMGMCSKFTMEDINYFIHANRRKDEHDFIPGVPFFMSKETQTKLEGFLAQHNTSLAYLTHFEHFTNGQEMAIQEIKMLAQRLRGCELSVIEQEAQKFLSGRGGWRDMPHQDLKILGLMDHEDAVIIDEIGKNPDRFFALLKETSNPARYAEQFLSLYARSEEAAKGNADICTRLGKLATPQTKNSSAAQKQTTPRDGRNTLVRRGLSKILDLTQKLPPTQSRKWIRETLVKGYRFFYPKQGSNR